MDYRAERALETIDRLTLAARWYHTSVINLFNYIQMDCHPDNGSIVYSVHAEVSRVIVDYWRMQEAAIQLTQGYYTKDIRNV